MSSYTRAQYAHNREVLLEKLFVFLSHDERFVAAWLTGSLGRGEGDELSDFDLRIVVADAYAEDLCGCSPHAVASVTNAGRRRLYEQFGRPLILREDASFGPKGGCYNHVIYRETAITVDWVLLPQKVARLPQHDYRLLFDKVGLAKEPPPVPESLEERVQQASRDVNLFWMMTAISIKYLLRGDTVQWDRFMFNNVQLVQDVKRRIAGEVWRYQRIEFPLVTIRAEQLAQIRRLCSEMLEEMPKLAALGGQVPDDPMSVIELWLSIE
jgi:hypothetical protein